MTGALRQGRAWQATGFGRHRNRLILVERPAPVPTPGRVVIEVEAAGVNLPDVLMVAGTYQLRPDPPFTPGREVVGTVIDTAPQDAALLGQRVVARPLLPHGGFAEVTVARTQDLFPLGDEVPATDAATLLVTYLTAHVALHERARLRAGETVLVLGGAGGVGSAAIQLAATAGARVVATSSNRERIAACHRLGAELVVDRGRDDPLAAVEEFTDGHGADVVIDPVGGALFGQARRALGWAGRAVLVGFASGELPELKANSILLRNQSVLGLHLGPYQDHAPQVTRAAFADLLRLHAAGELVPLVSAVHPLEDALVALDALEASTAIGNVVLHLR